MKTKNTLIDIYITNPSKAGAKRIATHLLKKKLIACANIFDNVNSLYKWKGKVVDENETILVAKTVESKWSKVKSEVEKIHPYSIPCIIKISVESNKKYFDWVKREVRTK